MLHVTNSKISDVSRSAGLVVAFVSIDQVKGNTLLRMGGNLISYPTEQFSKLLFVRKILLHQTCEAYENSSTDIEELFSHVKDLKVVFCVLSRMPSTTEILSSCTGSQEPI